MQKIQELKIQKCKQYKIVDFAYTELLESETFKQYEEWLAQNYQANMHYLEGDKAKKRKSLNKLLNNCKSALVFLFSHLETKKFLLENQFENQMASFVMGYEGLDYHYFIKDALTKIKDEYLGNISGEVCVDTLPILERDLACRSGLGFIGKNSMLIHPEYGSHVLIGTILLEDVLELDMKPKIDMDCGKCVSCIKSCPTSALVEPHLLDSRKCISTYTIEERKTEKGPFGYYNQNYLFGCDRCQDVCPYNIKALKLVLPKMEGEMALHILNFFLRRDKQDIINELQEMSNKGYQKMFKGTSLERTGRMGMLKNLMY